MKELGTSESTYHKSRAGTAYSVSKRMLEFGLLEPNESSVPGDEKLVRITPDGINALQEWLTPPIPLPDIAHSADLIRLRFFFLGVIDQDKRLAFIDDTLKGLENFLARCEALIQANEDIGDYFGALATISSILETRARIEWLKIAREWVVDPMDSSEDWSDKILRRIAELDQPGV